jgi:uncharacterized protein
VNGLPGARTEEPVVQRVFARQRIWLLEEAVFARAAALLGRYEPRPDLVVGIARGGMPLAHRLSEHFGVAVLELAVRHNKSDEIYLPATGDVELPDPPSALGRIPAGRRLLVADDICGTGATLKAVLPWLGEHLRPSALRAVVLCRSEAAHFTPDTWLWDTRDWVVFPWNEPVGEPTEALVLPDGVRTKEGA